MKKISIRKAALHGFGLIAISVGIVSLIQDATAEQTCDSPFVLRAAVENINAFSAQVFNRKSVERIQNAKEVDFDPDEGRHYCEGELVSPEGSIAPSRYEFYVNERGRAVVFANPVSLSNNRTKKKQAEQNKHWSDYEQSLKKVDAEMHRESGFRQTDKGVLVLPDLNSEESGRAEKKQAEDEGESDWKSGFAQGNVENWTDNGPGNSFLINCDVGGKGYGASIFIEIKGSNPPPSDTVRVFVDGEEFTFLTDSTGTIGTDCHACSDNFGALWNSLRKGKQLLVTLSDGRSSPFSLKGAGRVLDEKACRTDFDGP